MQVATCPVCGGNGLVDEGFYRQTSGQWTSVGGTETCRSCNGKGWVTLDEDELPYANPYNTSPLDYLEPVTTSSESDAGPYWGLSGGRH